MAYIPSTIAGAPIAVEADFGYPNGGEGMSVSETILDVSVKATSRFVYKFSDSADHNIEDVILEQLLPRVIKIVDGVSFDLMIYAPTDTWGKYNLTVLILN